MAHLNAPIGSMEYENLFADLDPPQKVASGTIVKQASEVTFKRGTILGKDADGKLNMLGVAEGLTADCVLCDDTIIGTDADVVVPVYVIGCFNQNALIMADSYTLTQGDKDKLRERGIFLGTVMP